MAKPHAWNQGAVGNVLQSKAFDALHNPAHMRRLGIPSTWYETFHTNGCQVTDAATIYYCDSIEEGRHRTLPTTRRYPLFFMINLATGGGSPVDLSRYGGLADMYIDYVRVYGQRR